MAQTSKELSLEQVTRILKGRMARSALHHVGNVDVRTGTALEIAGLFTRTSEEKFDEELARIILEPNHARRVSAGAGPALFYRDAANEKQQFALELKVLLFSPDLRLRAAALQHFKALGPQRALTKKVLALVDESEAGCLSAEASKWQPAALRLHDSIESDILCQLAGLRQSIAQRFEEGLRFYVPKLLKPTLAELEDLGIAFPKPSEKREEIAAEVARLAGTENSLSAACDAYLETIGTLPLAGAASFVALVEGWRRERGGESSVGAELWTWAQTSSPLRKFYVSCYFLAHPTQFDASLGPAILQGVSDIFPSTDDEADAETRSPSYWFWTVFEELAQHYMQYLETIAPGAQGEPMATSAWWLARRFAEVLSERPNAVRHLRQVALEPAARNSQLAWRFANARIDRSAASLATHWSLWQIAMIGAIEAGNVASLTALWSPAERERLQALVIKRLMFWSPTTKQDESGRTYLFEVDLVTRLTTWSRVFGENERQDLLPEIARFYTELTEPKAFEQKFGVLAEADPADQLIVTNAARLLSLCDLLPLDPVWEKLTDSKWRSTTFGKLSAIALETLFFAFASALHKGGEKWTSSLPHIYAQACEESGGDKKRVEAMFAFVVISCVHSYSVSAIERLLRGPMRPEVLELAEEWIEQLQALGRQVSPWVAGRIRAVIASMSAAL